MRKALMIAVSSIALTACTTMNEDSSMATQVPPGDTAANGSGDTADTADTTVNDNPLTAEWTGPFEGVPPWDEMEPELFGPAFEEAMAEVRAEVQAVIDNAATNSDLSVIANDPVYQNCASIADAIRLAESDASCGGP